MLVIGYDVPVVGQAHTDIWSSGIARAKIPVAPPGECHDAMTDLSVLPMKMRDATSRRQVLLALVVMGATAGCWHDGPAVADSLATGVVVRAVEAAIRDEASDGWVKLGERRIGRSAALEAISVGRDRGLFRRIQIVAHGSIDLLDVKITFGNGEAFVPGQRLVFDESRSRRIFELRGNPRSIRRIDFQTGYLPAGASARIELLAQ